MLAQSELELRSRDGNQQQYLEYGLTPSILSTCRQMNDEGSDILYGCNTFYIYCFGSNRYPHEYLCYDRICPLLRYRQDVVNCVYYTEHFAPLANEVAVSKVRNWKILVSTWVYESSTYRIYPSRAMVELCRLMRASSPLSVKVLVIPQGIEAAPGENYHDIHQVLRPFELLRIRDGRFTIRDANFDEVQEGFFGAISVVPVFTSQLSGPNSQNSLIRLIGGNTAVEDCSEMYSCLLSYAQCFKRYGPFRVDMGLGWGAYLKEDHLAPCDQRYLRLGLTNPFKDADRDCDNSHPIEEILSWAKEDTDSEDLAGFKEKRANVLEYLEPQYARIMIASGNCVQFIKEQKQGGGLFDVEGRMCLCCGECRVPCWLNKDLMAEGIVLLEQYATSFLRDAPLKVQREIKKQQRAFDSHYFDIDREELLVKMNHALDIGDDEHYVSSFKRVFNNMELQRLEIREARKNLLNFDITNDRRCDIDIELVRCDDLVDFEVNEPDYEVRVS